MVTHIQQLENRRQTNEKNKACTIDASPPQTKADSLGVAKPLTVVLQHFFTKLVRPKGFPKVFG